jgi:hypothetical protein
MLIATSKTCQLIQFAGITLRRMLAATLLLAASQTAMAGIAVNHASTHLEDDHYLLDADITYHLNDTVLEALDNGVPLTLQLDVVVEQPRDYLWDESIGKQSYRFQLQYHALSEKYLVRNLQTDKQEIYPTLRTALLALGRFKSLDLIKNNLLKKDAHYQVRLRISLDIASLPAPMRPLAWLTTDWHLGSDWFSCPLTP